MSKRREELLNANVVCMNDSELISLAHRLFGLLENGGSTVYLIYLVVLVATTAACCVLALADRPLAFVIVVVMAILAVFSSMKLFKYEEERMIPISRKFDEVKEELDRRGYNVNVVRMPYGYSYVVHCMNMLDIRKK